MAPPQGGAALLDPQSRAGPAQAPPVRSGAQRAVYMETYGCQMNVSDSEVVLSVLADSGYVLTDDCAAADVLLINTCAIREKAEQRVWQRLAYFRSLRLGAVVGVLGCMAERLKEQLLEADRLADLVAGPDAYRDLPRLIDAVRGGADGAAAMNVQLSAEETYGDLVPVRPAGARSAFVTIMRGCDNACAFCIVPYVRGRERSRDPQSIEYEVRTLSEAGVREVTLLGQNVNSYAWAPGGGGGEGGAPELGVLAGGVFGGAPAPAAAAAAAEAPPPSYYADGFSTRYEPGARRAGAVRFAELLRRVAAVDPEMRVRFTSPHPKDFPDEVLDAIAALPNVCASLHMPAQSGSDAVLARMGRGYTAASYLALAARVRRRLGAACGLTSDFISGFCGETEEDHAATVALVRSASYSQCFMFAYSERAGTPAARRLDDDVPEAVKQRRLAEVVAAFRDSSALSNQAEIGRVHLVLVEGPSKKAELAQVQGRTDSGKVAVFDALRPLGAYPAAPGLPRGDGGAGGGGEGWGSAAPRPPRAGDYVAVRVDAATTGTLLGTALGRTTLAGFHAAHGAAYVEAGAGAGAGAR